MFFPGLCSPSLPFQDAISDLRRINMFQSLIQGTIRSTPSVQEVPYSSILFVLLGVALNSVGLLSHLTRDPVTEV